MSIVSIFLYDGWSRFLLSFKFIGLFYNLNGAWSFDLNFRGFHRPVTAPKSHFNHFSKNSISWEFKISSKIVNPKVSSDEISEIRPSCR